MTHRPEDRVGIEPGTRNSRLNVAIYKTIANASNSLPNFRGKIRVVEAAFKFLKLEAHHITECVSIKRPIQFNAVLDFHSRHERWTYLMSEYEKETTEFLFRLFKGEGSFLDVGANIGLIAIPFSKLVAERDGSFPDVYCVEAVATNSNRLQENIALNGLEKIISVIAMAVGEKEKQVEIQIEGNLRPGEGTGTANILADGTSHPCERVPIAVTTIDNLVAKGRISHDISLIKIDVDGYDLKVLQGSVNLLRRCRPIIFGEFMAHCLKWHGQSVIDVIDFAASHKYKTYRRIEHEFVFSDVSFGNFKSDLLIVPEEKIGTLNWCIARD